MTSVFTRIKDNIMADVHQVLDEKEQKSPVATLNQYLRNCEKETRKIEGLINRQTQLKRQFYQEKEQAHYMVDKRTRQAELATAAGELDLANRAQEEVAYYTKQADKLDELYQQADTDIFQMQNQLQDMKNKLKEMHTKRLELMSRENVAHASRRINQSMVQFSENNPFFRFEEAERQIQDLELRINADYERSTFDMRMARLERDMKEKDTGKQKAKAKIEPSA